MSTAAVEPQSQLVWELLDDIDEVTAYDAEVPDNPPVDAEGRVRPYAVLYMSPGRLYAGALNGAQTSTDSTFTVTCVAGHRRGALWCVDQVRDQLVGGKVTIADRDYTIRAREDFDPGTVRRDDDVIPPRHWVPLEFRLHVP